MGNEPYRDAAKPGDFEPRPVFERPARWPDEQNWQNGAPGAEHHGWPEHVRAQTRIDVPPARQPDLDVDFTNADRDHLQQTAQILANLGYADESALVELIVERGY